MLLVPKRRKYRKQMVKPISWVSVRWSQVAFWDIGLKAIESSYITNRQIEAARKVIVRYVKKIWKLWIRIFPDVPITKKWLEMPMGKGKWDVDTFAARVRKWKIMFEITWLDIEAAKKVLWQAAKKLPVKAVIVTKDTIN